MRGYIPVCMLQSVLCNANHSFDFIAILGKNFLINEFFYPCEQKNEEMPFKPSELWSRQRNQHTVVYGFDWLPACYTTKIVKEYSCFTF